MHLNIFLSVATLALCVAAGDYGTPAPEYKAPAPAPAPEYKAPAPAPAPEYKAPPPPPPPTPEYKAPPPPPPAPEYKAPAPAPAPEYKPPAPAPSYGDCTDGAFRCYGAESKFQKCDHGKWVDFDCAPGTKCYPKGEGLILCDYPPSTPKYY